MIPNDGPKSTPMKVPSSAKAAISPRVRLNQASPSMSRYLNGCSSDETESDDGKMRSVSTVMKVDDCEVRQVDPRRVRAVAAQLPPSEELREAADVFDLLSDPNRLGCSSVCATPASSSVISLRPSR
jgi:hypothetical protein